MAAATPLALLERLVAFNTESHRSNLGLMNFVADYLRGLGIDPLIMPNGAGDKAALLCSIGPQEDGGVVLSGHTDVVPVAGQNWTSDPFTLRVADGKAYGRGAVDMKGFAAVALAAIPEFQRAGLKKPIHLLLSFDEETTCLGSLDFIRRFGVDLPKPAIAIVGEPTEMQVVDAHKSVVTFNTFVHGFECHSSKPDLGANAISGAALMVAELDRIADDMRALGDPTGRFDPPFTTVHVGELHGGTARNIVPKLAQFHWEYRGVPGMDPDVLVVERLAQFVDSTVLPKLQRTFPQARVETINDVRVPGLRPAPGSPAELLGLTLTGRNRTGTVPYGTESGHFQDAGLATIVCGPGSINQAHQPDEYITLTALDEGAQFMTRLAAHLSR
ncbi:MAG: acetylornithine deacetylase [Beijerinckiaceae bacterium]